MDNKEVCTWRKTNLKKRLLDCRMMLILHEMLTPAESEKVLERIRKAFSKQPKDAI